MGLSRLPRALPACFVLLLGAPLFAQAAPGDLDCGFGSGGVINRDLGTLEAAFAVDRQSNGRLIVMGSDGGQIRLTRFLATGVLDGSFAGGGSIVHALGGNGSAMRVDGQGRIVVVGGINDPDSDVFVARFTAAGAVDTSFGGGDGWLSFDFDAATNGVGRDAALAMAIDGSDRILAAGYMDANGNTFNPSNANQAVARITQTGVMDNSFGGGDGLVLVSSPGSSHDDDARAVAIDSQGRIALVGVTLFGNAFNSGPRDTIVARLSSNGTLDSSFDGDGVATIDLTQTGADDFGLDVAVDSSDRLMVLGSIGDDPTIARLLNNAALDNSFGGGDGIVQRSFLGGQDVTEHILMQADGKFFVTGWPVEGFSFRFASMRFTAAGALDTSWGGDGVVTTAIGSIDRAYAALLQPDQKLILAGGLNNDTNLVIARYLNDGQSDNTTTTAITTHTPDPSAPGQAVQVSYTVLSGGGIVPSGNVTVGDGVNSCTATVAAGSCSVALSTSGTRQLTAQYAGNGCFGGSASSAVAHTVQLVTHTVTPSAGSGGALAPATAQTVVSGQGISFQLQPDAGFRVQSVSGCGGVRTGNQYNISTVTTDCTVNAIFNRNPVATAGSLTLLEDAGMQVGALSAVDDDALTYSLVSNATRGNVQITNSSTGAFTYTPNTDANGADSFSFKANDGGVDSAPANISIAITAVNDAPALSLAASPSHPAGTSGLQSVPGFAQTDLGPTDEDSMQTVSEYLIVARNDPAGVIAPGAGGLAIASNGTLSYQLTGIGGTATIDVSARDSGGTANGGIDVSPARQFTITVGMGVDLQIAMTDQRASITPGSLNRYAIVVANEGPNAVSEAALVDSLPATLSNGSWQCLQALSTALCPSPASGVGDLDVDIDLPVNTFLRFDVNATVNANLGDVLINTASITPPMNVIDLAPGNNSVVDQTLVVADAVFADGFEEAGGGLTVTGAAQALR